METIIAAFVVIMCVMLTVLLISEDKKSTKLSEENGMLKADLRRQQVDTPGDTLTVTGIENAVRALGSLPERNGNVIQFSTHEQEFLIDTARLPLVFVQEGFNVDDAWDRDRLRHAALLLSDEIVMAKASVGTSEDEWPLNIYVTTLDNDISFRKNLPKYIDIIERATKKLGAIYNGLADAALTQSLSQQRNRVLT